MRQGTGPITPRHWLRLLPWLLAPVLIWWAFRSLQLDNILQSLARISWWQVLILLLTNGIIILLFGLRWWLLLRRSHPEISIHRLAGYWLAGFAVSYSTPVPGVGGEPVLALLLIKREKFDSSGAVAAVGLDRLLDGAFSAAALTAMAVFVLEWQLLQGNLAAQAALVPALILALLAAILIPLIAGRKPFGWLAERLPRVRLFSFLRRSETRFSQLTQNQAGNLLLALLVSALAWLVIVAEYWLLAYFLGIDLNPQQLIAVATAGRLAFIFPLPAGVGALEAALFFIFRELGLDQAAGISAALIIRARDLIFIGAGLLLGSVLMGGWRHLRRASDATADEYVAAEPN